MYRFWRPLGWNPVLKSNSRGPKRRSLSIQSSLQLLQSWHGVWSVARMPDRWSTWSTRPVHYSYQWIVDARDGHRIVTWSKHLNIWNMLLGPQAWERSMDRRSKSNDHLAWISRERLCLSIWGHWAKQHNKVYYRRRKEPCDRRTSYNADKQRRPCFVPQTVEQYHCIVQNRIQNHWQGISLVGKSIYRCGWHLVVFIHHWNPCVYLADDFDLHLLLHL